MADEPILSPLHSFNHWLSPRGFSMSAITKRPKLAPRWRNWNTSDSDRLLYRHLRRGRIHRQGETEGGTVGPVLTYPQPSAVGLDNGAADR